MLGWLAPLSVLGAVLGLAPVRPFEEEAQDRAIEWVTEFAGELLRHFRKTRGRGALRDLAGAIRAPGASTLEQHWPLLAQRLTEWHAAATSGFLADTWEAEMCEQLRALRDDLLSRGLAARREPFEGGFKVMLLVTEAIGLTEHCAAVVREHLPPALTTLVKDQAPWRFLEERRPLWDCLEWAFWAQDVGNGWSGLRGKLWLTVLKSNVFQLYGVTEALTVQFSLMPLCLQQTVWHHAAEKGVENYFKNPWTDCVQHGFFNAIDHLVNAAVGHRAEETFGIAQQAKDGLQIGYWQSFRNFAYHIPRLAPWTWWHLHTKVSHVIDLLEANVETFAAEATGLLEHPELQQDAYPFSGSTDRSWLALHFVLYGHWKEDVCALAPKTCSVFREPGLFADTEDVGGCPSMGINERLMWTVVEPGGRLAAHSGESWRINIQMCVSGCEGAELHINGTVFPYLFGKAMAWQDSFRHTVVNHGDTPRWVMQVTVTHPDLRQAWEEECGRWPAVRRRLGSLARSSLARVSRARGPYRDVDVQDQGVAPPEETMHDCFANEETFLMCCCRREDCTPTFLQWRQCCNHLLHRCPMPEVSPGS